MECAHDWTAVIARKWLALVLTGVSTLCGGIVDAQTVNWVTAQSPAARCCMSMAYDGTSKASLLFGGAIPSQLYGDTWMWRLGWHRLSPANSPSPRIGAALAYDATAGNVVLFGGTTANVPPGSPGTYYNDTWTWDGTTWTQQFPPISPSARGCAAPGMVYDGATGTVMLFGGANRTGALGDTWIWDGTAKTWTQLHPSNHPSARAALMAYDEASETVVLFGSPSTDAADTETWSWDGAAKGWTQQFPAHSPPVSQGAMAYDSAIRDVVLFGGFVGGWQNTLNSTWTWNGTDWSEIYPITTPPNRYDFNMDYDPFNRVVFMFGGYSTGPALGDTWLLDFEP
jgi:hypothetical protein